MPSNQSDSPATKAYEVVGPAAFVTLGSTWTKLTEGQQVPADVEAATITHLLAAGLIVEANA
jgi:hypothetical protein